MNTFIMRTRAIIRISITGNKETRFLAFMFTIKKNKNKIEKETQRHYI